MLECLQDRRLKWFGHLERMKQNAYFSTCRILGNSLKDDLGKHGVRSVPNPECIWGNRLLVLL